MKKIALICAISSLWLSQIDAQQAPLKVGEKLSDLTVGPVLNFQLDSFRISDSSHKLLVFDFWSTWCGTCIRAFPRLDSLQKTFSDEILIMLVTHQDMERVKVFLEKNDYAKGTLLPTIVDDTILKGFFPHKGLPHVVWLDNKGIIRYIGTSDELTEENIRSALIGDYPL